MNCTFEVPCIMFISMYGVYLLSQAILLYMFIWRLYDLTNQNPKINKFRRKQILLAIGTMTTGIIIVILNLVSQNRFLFNSLLGIEQSVLCLSIIGTFKWSKCRKRNYINNLTQHIDVQRSTANINLNDQANDDNDDEELIDIYSLK